MKKYWKLTAIITVIVLSIGTFYASTALSAENYPEFVIKTKSGNAEEINSLVLKGAYENLSPGNYVSKPLTITAEGSTYRNDSFLARLIGDPPTAIKNWQTEYRTFMRAKKPAPDLYFENEQLLAYTDVEYKANSLRLTDFRFAVSILNKKNGEINSFTVKVPDSEEFDYISIEDVQILDGELNLVTQGMRRSGEAFSNEKHVYTIDIIEQTISSHEPIIQIPEDETGTYMDARLIEASTKQINEHLVFLKTENKIIQENEADRNQELNQEIISYNLKTKEKKILELPENLRLMENEVSFFDGTTIYFIKADGDKLTVIPFQIAENQAGKSFEIQLPGETNTTQLPLISIQDGKLYAVSSLANPPLSASVLLADMSTGKILYDGVAMPKNPSNEIDNFELYIYNMVVE